jgi:hypothetical protein
LRTMQEAVTLKPNWKLCNKKKVWGPRKLNFKAVGAITVFPKKSQIRKKRQKCEGISFIYLYGRKNWNAGNQKLFFTFRRSGDS